MSKIECVSPVFTLAEKVSMDLSNIRASASDYRVEVLFTMQSEDQNEVRVIMKLGSEHFNVATISEGQRVDDYTTTHDTLEEAMQSAALSLAECFTN